MEAAVIPAEIQQKAAGIVEKAASHVVVDQESYDIATNTLKGLKAMMKEIEATFDPIAKKAHDAWKEVLAQKKRHIEPLETADKILRRKASDWFAEQERARREAERRALEEARRKAEEEQIARAQLLQDSGATELAESVISQPVKVGPVKVNAPAPDKNGVGFREVWTFEIVDASLIPREFLIPDEAAIRKHAQTMKGKANIPGVRVFARKDAIVR